MNNLRQQFSHENVYKLTDIEVKHRMDKQKEQYTQIINDLSEELDSFKIISEQVSSASLEESIKSFENHNEVLCKSVQDSDRKLSESNLTNEILKKRNSELSKKLEEKQQEAEKLRLENIRYKSQLTLQKNLCKCVQSPSYSQKYSDAIINLDASHRFAYELQKRSSEESLKREESHRAFSQKIEMLDNTIYSLGSTLEKKEKELSRVKNRLQEVSNSEDQLQSKFDLNIMRMDEIENEKYL